MLQLSGAAGVAVAGAGSLTGLTGTTHDTYSEAGADIIVDTDGSGDYDNLHDAEEAASEGGVIYFRDGYHFAEWIEATTPHITIVGESQNVELDSRDANQAVFFCADEQELRNVTLINREGSDGLATQNSGEKEEGDKRTFTIEETRIANHRHEALKDYVRSPSVTLRSI